MPVRKRQPRRGAGRPAGGSDDVVQAVLEAALQQLGARGYAGLSIDEVARVAGVNKTTVYRRWPTKSALILAALGTMASEEPAFEPGGDLRADLIAVLDNKARRLATPRGRAIGLALLNLDGDPEIIQALRARRFQLSTEIIQRAIDRGELLPTVDAGLISEMLLAPVVVRVLAYEQPASAHYIAALVDGVLAGFSPAARSAPRAGARRKKQP
jgi:AcrR family transcriptional regulator